MKKIIIIGAGAMGSAFAMSCVEWSSQMKSKLDFKV